MKPVATPTSTGLLHGPIDVVDDLPVERFHELAPGGEESHRVVRSVWLPTNRELAHLRAGGEVVIELDVLADPPPPVRVSLLLGDTARSIAPERDMRHHAGCIRCFLDRAGERDLPKRRTG